MADVDPKVRDQLRERLYLELRRRGLPEGDARAQADEMVQKGARAYEKLVRDNAPAPEDDNRPSLLKWRRGKDEFDLGRMLGAGDANAPLPDTVIGNLDERVAEWEQARQDAVDAGKQGTADPETRAAGEQAAAVGLRPGSGSDSLVEAFVNEQSDNPDLARLLFRQLFGGRLPTTADIEEIADYIADSGEWGDWDPDDDQSLRDVLIFLSAAQGDVTKLDPLLGRAVAQNRGDVPELITRWRWNGKVYDVDDITKALLLGQGTQEAGLESSFGATERDPGASWQVGGWLKNRPDLIQTVVTAAQDAGVDATTLAASLYYQGGLEALAPPTDDEKEARREVGRYSGRTGSAELDGAIADSVAALDVASRTAERAGAAGRKAAERRKEGGKDETFGRGLGAAAGAAGASDRIGKEEKARYNRGRSAARAERQRRATERNRITETARKVAYYEKAFGGPLPAVIAMADEGLAGRMRDGTIGRDDLLAIDTIMQRSNYGQTLAAAKSKDPAATRKQYDAWKNAWAAYYDEQDAASRAAPVVTYSLPDATEVRESMRTIFRAWFQRDPSDMEVNSFKSTLDRAVIDSANQRAQAEVTGGNYSNPDPQSMLSEFVRNSPEYRQLFDNKPGGMSEEDYAGTFRSAGTRFFGDVVADDAVRAGMMSGSTQTTIGQMAASKQADQSSSYQERLAQAAEVIASMT
jgi:hypothetical protein